MKTKLLSFILLLIVFAACSGNEENETFKFGRCPLPNDTVSWGNGMVKYGEWTFGYTWIDGNFGIGYGGVEVNNLHSDCGCPFNGHETGGVGNTYAVNLISGQDTVVTFRWKYNTFCEMEVFDNWKGKTDAGAQINMLLQDFLQKYPGQFTVSSIDPLQYNADYSQKIHVNAWFTAVNPSIGRLKKLKISEERN